MKTISLANSTLVALVDDDDYARVVAHGWCVHRGGGYRKKLYAMANVKNDGIWTRILMHRFIMSAIPGQRIDHCDNDGLNNQKSNLRFATSNQNQHNSGHRIYQGSRSSRFKGVHLAKNIRKWVAQISCNGIHYYLGAFADEEEAARTYDAKAKELHGEFAKPNFR